MSSRSGEVGGEAKLGDDRGEGEEPQTAADEARTTHRTPASLAALEDIQGSPSVDSDAVGLERVFDA